MRSQLRLKTLKLNLLMLHLFPLRRIQTQICFQLQQEKVSNLLKTRGLRDQLSKVPQITQKSTNLLLLKQQFQTSENKWNKNKSKVS